MSLLFCGLLCAAGIRSYGQSTEVQQLVLNVEKLAQMKNILADMKRGYQIVATGYNSVKNIAQGNFSLHEVFLDGLYLVSPEVRKYYKVAEIIAQQRAIVSEYKSAFKQFSSSGSFTASELEYLSRVYQNLFTESLDHLDQLATVITVNKLRMSDQERLQAIDKIFAATSNKLIFLRDFNRQAGLLGVQRAKEQTEVSGLGNYYKTN
ncbi:MAG: TerB family tellurite resistance protein [Flavobacterium sp.]|nr:MAG: TerB family tellurite resistance protein [Flavobacterium sp.]